MMQTLQKTISNFGVNESVQSNSPAVRQAGNNNFQPTQQKLNNVAEAKPLLPEKNIGKVLVSLGIKESHVNAALQRQKIARKSLPVVARDMGLVSSEKIAEALSIVTGSPYFSANEVDKIDAEEIRKIQELITNLSQEFLFKGFIPVGFNGDSLKVAISSLEAMNEANNTFRAYRPSIYIASEKTIQRVHRMFFSNTDKAFDKAMAEAIVALRSTSDDTSGQDAIQRLIGSLLRHTCYVGASDIYLWSTALAGTIKLKIGGRGTVFRSVEKDVFDRMVNFLVMNSGKQEELNRVRRTQKSNYALQQLLKSLMTS